MKKLFLAILLLLVMVNPIQAQEPIKYFFPLILKNDCEIDTMAGFWQLIVPETTTNYVLNPSAETTGNFSAAPGGGTITRVSTNQKFGLYSYRVQTTANGHGIFLTLSTLSNAIHYVTVHVKGTLPTNGWTWSLNGTNFNFPTLIEQIDSEWKVYGFEFPAAQANGSTTLRIYQNSTGTGDFYIDGIQVEQKSYWTTYCDGSQEGCTWNGASDASTSTRDALSRAGGRVYNFDDYYFQIEKELGVGNSSQTINTDEYALLPGGEFNSKKVHPRVFTLTGNIIADYNSDTDLNTKRKALLEVLDTDDGQPVTLRYIGSTIHKEIKAFYESGLEADIEAPGCWEKAAIRFISPDPFFYSYGNKAQSLDYEDSATFTLVAGRLKSTGQWSNLGPLTAGGTYTAVYDLAQDDTYLYIGGDFLNFNNIANADYIVRYNKQTGAYSALGTGANNTVNALTIRNGILYAGGRFTTIGGVAAANVAKWDGTNWAALAGGTKNATLALAISHSGILFAGGDFTVSGDTAPGDYIAQWNGSAWSAVGTGMDDSVDGLLVLPDNTLYATGLFDNSGGVLTRRIAKWDGTNWTALAYGLDTGTGSALAYINNKLYVGGSIPGSSFTPFSYIGKWNGTAWSAVGSSADNTVYSLETGPDGMLFAGGAFTSIGGISLADRVAKWNGSSWAHLDINLPGSPQIYTIKTGKQDAIVKNKYDIFIGFDTTGTGVFAGKTTVQNNGNLFAYPKIIFSRSGGTSAIVESLRNETTGLELFLNYSLESGETLTIDLTPTKKSITSDVLGDVSDAVLANSDFGQWSLKTGDNSITNFINTSGSPTVGAFLQWREAFKSFD